MGMTVSSFLWVTEDLYHRPSGLGGCASPRLGGYLFGVGFGLLGCRGFRGLGL